jgi:hypothetical protein
VSKTEQRLLYIVIAMVVAFVLIFVLIAHVPAEWLERAGRATEQYTSSDK